MKRQQPDLVAWDDRALSLWGCLLSCTCVARPLGDRITLDFPAEAPWAEADPGPVRATVAAMLSIPSASVTFVGRNRMAAFVGDAAQGRNGSDMLPAPCSLNIFAPSPRRCRPPSSIPLLCPRCAIFCASSVAANPRILRHAPSSRLRHCYERIRWLGPNRLSRWEDIIWQGRKGILGCYEMKNNCCYV